MNSFNAGVSTVTLAMFVSCMSHRWRELSCTQNILQHVVGVYGVQLMCLWGCVISVCNQCIAYRVHVVNVIIRTTQIVICNLSVST